MKISKNQIIYNIFLILAVISFLAIVINFNLVPYRGTNLTNALNQANNKIISNFIAFTVGFFSLIWVIQGYLLWKTDFFNSEQFRGMKALSKYGKLAVIGGIIGIALSVVYFLFLNR